MARLTLPGFVRWCWRSLAEDGGPGVGWANGTHQLGWLAGLAVTVHLVALYLPGTPDQALELPLFPGADKVIHLLLFFVPVFLIGRLTGRVGLVAFGFALHAVVSELIQWRFIPYRDGDVWDAMVDLIGVGLAVVFLTLRKSTRR